MVYAKDSICNENSELDTKCKFHHQNKPLVCIKLITVSVAALTRHGFREGGAEMRTFYFISKWAPRRIQRVPYTNRAKWTYRRAWIHILSALQSSLATHGELTSNASTRHSTAQNNVQQEHAYDDTVILQDKNMSNTLSLKSRAASMKTPANYIKVKQNWLFLIGFFLI